MRRDIFLTYDLGASGTVFSSKNGLASGVTPPDAFVVLF